MDIDAAKWIPWLPALAAVLCGLCAARRSLCVWAAPVCIAGIAGAFLLTLGAAGAVESGRPLPIRCFEWIAVGQFDAGFGYLLDPLTIVMLLVVTGIGLLVAIYAAGYMAGDRGYARFFAGVSLFIFAMTTLVMADNLVLLYLGWEGVGLCSYLLIGHYYQRPSAVAAAKKAFIVNRIGDLGFAVGIFMVYTRYGSLAIADILEHAGHGVADGRDLWIPFLLMLGAFGKSAQIPLYLWLPDAMEGPTPVSALIHAATMVTAGVYMVTRLLPLFALCPAALPTVATIGAATALFAATIALCQNDIKRVFAYSTISQLGYMFMGVGALSTVGGIFHLVTHAFFKALLFLTAGSVMHALAGQLDLTRMSGLRRKMPVTCWLMFVGCLALAGFPFTAGFYSKDMILTATLERGVNGHDPLYVLLGLAGLFTALLTAFYTFRVWFRVFMGETRYELGDEHHGADVAETDGDAGHVAHVHDVHEVGRLMNAPLFVLAAGAILAGMVLSMGATGSLIERAVRGATGAMHDPVGHAGVHLHGTMLWVSSVVAIAGIGAAAWFHWLRRPATGAITARFPGVVRLLADKYYVDEACQRLVVGPLRQLGELCQAVDRLVVEGLVQLVGFLPRLLGLTIRPAQNGALQGYGLGMAAGVAAILVLLLLVIW